VAARGGVYLYSWLLPCLWTRRLWARGLRLQIASGIQATVPLHPERGRKDDAMAVVASISEPPADTRIAHLDVPGTYPMPVGEGVCSPWAPAEGRRLSPRVLEAPAAWPIPLSDSIASRAVRPPSQALAGRGPSAQPGREGRKGSTAGAWAGNWLRAARTGFCYLTAENSGDCRTSDKGQWPLACALNRANRPMRCPRHTLVAGH